MSNAQIFPHTQNAHTSAHSPTTEHTNKKRIANTATRFFHAHFPRTRRKRAFLLRGFLKSRNFPIFLQGVVIASLKMLEIHKGFLRFLPCTLLHLTKNLCISLFSETPCRSQKGELYGRERIGKAGPFRRAGQGSV